MTNGVNLLSDPAAIDDSEVVTCQNLIFRKPGIIGLRPALTFIRNLLNSAYVTPPTNFVGTPIAFTWLDSLGSDRELVMVYIDVDGVTRLTAAPNPDGAADVPNLGDLSSQPSLFRWQNTVYCFTGNDSGWVVTPDGFGSYATAPFVVGGSGNTNIRPRFAAIVGSRLVIANLGPGLENVVAFSDINDPLSFGNDLWNYGNSLSFPLAEFNGAPITGLASISTEAAGSPAQAATYVWTRKNVYQLLGEPAETDEFALPGIAPTGSLQVNKINVDAGCVSHATVCTTPYGAFWAGEDDVWFMRTGSIPMAVGTKIRPALQDTPPSLAWKWHAVYEDGFYKLAIFAPGQGPDSTSPCNTQWWLDCRNGPPQSFADARWFGPMVFNPSSAATTGQGTYCMQVDNRPGYETRAYALAPYFINVAPTQQLKGISLCAFAEGNYRDTCAPQMTNRPWQPVTAYEIGDIVTPQGSGGILVGNSNGVYWMCTTAGISDSTSPAWNSATTTITDNTVTWTTFNYSLLNGLQPGYEPATLQIGNEIVPLLLTKDQLAGTGFEVLNSGAEIAYWISEPHQISTQLLPDLETNLRTLPKQDGNELDIDVLTDLTMTRSFRTRGLPANVARRSIGGSAQLKLTSVPGVYVPDEVYWYLGYLDAGGATFTGIYVPPGWYATTASLAAAMIALMNAQVSTYFNLTLTSSWTGGNQVGVCAITNSIVDWAFITANDDWAGTQPGASTLTAAQLASNRFLAGLLGYSVTRTSIADDGDPMIATNIVYQTNYGDLQLAMLKQRVSMFGRGPV